MALILSACASEKIELRIVTPTQGFRVSADYVEGQPAPIPLEVYYQGSEPQRIALIDIKGVGTFACNLVSGMVNNCGTFGLTHTGDQTIKVSVGKSDGNQVSSEVRFSWTPLQGIERAASSVSGLFGAKNLGVGYVFFAILALIIFVIIIAAVVKGLSAVAIIVWVSTAIMTLTFFLIGTESALRAFNYMLTFWVVITVICLIGFAMSKNYSLSIPTTNVIFAEFGGGRRIEARIENGRIVGPDHANESEDLFAKITSASAQVFMKNYPNLEPGKDYQTIYLPEEKE